jgi:hypothetical protein
MPVGITSSQPIAQAIFEYIAKAEASGQRQSCEAFPDSGPLFMLAIIRALGDHAFRFFPNRCCPIM